MCTRKSGISEDLPGIKDLLNRYVFGGAFASLVLNMPPERAAANSLYAVTSARYPPENSTSGSAGVSSADVGIAKGIDNVSGSGMYTVNQSDDCGPVTYAALQPARTDGTAELVIEDLYTTWKRVLKV